MGIINKTVKICPRGTSIAYYKEKGYDAKYGQELEVKVEDLQPCSTVLVDTFCDYCGKLKPPQKYASYNARTKNGTEKCCCLDCAPLKQNEAMLKKYGYKSPLQVPEIKSRTQQTNLERYGSVSPCGNVEVREKQKKTSLGRYGFENPSQSKEVQLKIKQTNLERYGVENVFLSEEIKEKIRKTNLDRYGVENVFQNKDIQDKRTQTFIDKFGVPNPLQNKECLEKMKQTNMERYGVEHVSQLEETKQKVRQTSMKRYGVSNPFKNEEIKEKIKQTNLEKYGVECLLFLPSFHEHSREVDMERYGVPHHLQNPEILAKQKETFYKNGTCPTSNQQNYLHKLYGGELNCSLKMYNLDIYLPSEKIDIEYDGSGHLLGVKRGNITQEEFDRKEIIRNNTIKREGVKIMRIISTTDKLPTDQILLQMLSEAKQYFSETSHSWIAYDIDNSLMLNAVNKDVGGAFYNFGVLRTIKKSVL